MKTVQFLRGAILLIGILLSACAPSANSLAPAGVGGGKSLPDVIFTGAIESMNGDQWVVNGQTVKVDQSVLRDGPFVVGDTVKVEAAVADDGSVTAQRIETSSAADLVEISTSTPEPSSTTMPGGSIPSGPVFDANGNEAFGTVNSVTDTSITLNGQTFNFAKGVEIKGEIVAGATVKLHFTTNADGTLSVREIEIADPTQIGDNNGLDDNSNHDLNDDNGNDATSTDDHGGTSNTSDDSSNHDTNDDHGGNSGGDNDNSGGNSGSGG